MYSMFQLCGDRGRETSLGSCGDPKDTATENLTPWCLFSRKDRINIRKVCKINRI